MTQLLFVLAFVFSLFQFVPADAQTLGNGTPVQEPADRSLSPYFFVKSDDPTLDQLPLKATSAQVDIAGTIAQVRVRQVYRNEGRRALEAIYTFPASTRAAVHGLTMTIGERVITARIEERQEARRQYEQARDTGRTASLLEQQRPNVFQVNVANILPGDEIRVDLVYTEMLVPEKGVYEFVYPTVVGPRYTRSGGEDTPPTEQWTKNPYLHQGELPSATFGFRARIAAGMPILDVACPSHKVNISFPDRSRAEVTLDAAEKSGANRDLVLRYRLADSRIETGVLLAEAGGEKFFLCLVEPPQRFTQAAVPPREYVFVMDVSGSMNGFPIETSKQLLRSLLARLRPIDSFNVLFFSGGSWVLSPTSLEATDYNKNRALLEIERQRGGGGTELLPALERTFALPRAYTHLSRVVVIITDGYVNVEREAFALIRKHLGDSNVFAFGIGSAVNRHLIEGMARVGRGTPFVVLNQQEAPGAAARFLAYIESPLLTGIEVSTRGFDTYDLEPAAVPDLFAARPIVLVGKYRGEPSGSITVTGYTGQGRFERRLSVTRDLLNRDNDAIRYLWARERLAVLSDFADPQRDPGVRQEVVKLGLTYNLLTEFTSFVAIDEQRRSDGHVETVKQPLPLPQGVSDLAVGQGGMLALRSSMAAAPMAALAGGLVAESGYAGSKDALSVVPNVPAAPGVAAFNVEVIESRLQSRAAIDEARLKEVVRRSLAGMNACAGTDRVARAWRFKVSFDGRGRVVRVEALDPARWKTAASLLACLQRSIGAALVLPWPAGGYLVIEFR
jgi:Ca-activated chloride channel family protein